MAVNTISVNQEQQRYQKPTVGKTIAGVAAGYVTRNILSTLGPAPIQNYCHGKIAEAGKEISEGGIEKISSAMQDVLDKTGLTQKGVKIVRINDENTSTVTDWIKKDARRGLWPLLGKHFAENQAESTVKQLKDKINAFFCISGNSIVMPEKGMEQAFLHETGHAMNAHFGKITKLAMNSRSMQVLALPILLIGLLTPKKNKDEKPKNIIDKTTTFIKENAGKLTFLCFAPTLIDEAMASIKTGKLAKKFFPELSKSITKTNKYGYLTYVAMSIFAGLGTYLGIKLKDTIAQPKAEFNAHQA